MYLVDIAISPASWIGSRMPALVNFSKLCGIPGISEWCCNARYFRSGVAGKRETQQSIFPETILVRYGQYSLSIAQ